MFAVLKTGGKQYKVQSGDVLRVEKLAAAAGEKIQFNEILMVGSTIGAPLVAGAGVQAEVIDQIKGEKLIHYVKRRRKHSSQRKKGHRQQLTLLRITDILEAGADATGVKAAIGAGSAPKTAVEAAAPKKAAKAAAPAAGADDLTTITGVGPAAAKKLVEAGITTFAQLASVDVETFDAVKVKPEWVEQAKELAK
ncbi:50S ribosomal protein L21 [Celeribacter baekdonensis]|uniref:Large ribosomal subunit protein bL21 n=2 Tax=Celeribacter baekdonensis TaxID=875171 RepID=K2J9T9_9RHOB|nr:50S ribosomal protein L21 [Celeribacter baekdonensis]AVW91134.1 50S ribosomal protein L21 [Celeribacter baekdonensis]EKE71973.1 50S ribosomal protein L21/unknown domain fusion protein [Celeribacter baekdonensis B30]